MSRYELRTVAEGASDAWDTAQKSHKPILKDCSDALIQAADEIERLHNLFGSRFHLDASCGSCGGPLEVERDAICGRCTDKQAADELERLQAIVDKQVKALAACRRELLLYAGDPEDHDTGTAEALSLCEAAEQARKT